MSRPSRCVVPASLLVLSCGLLCGLGACSNPLAFDERDTETLASSTRLREIRTLDLDDFRAPPGQQRGAPGAPAVGSAEAGALTRERIEAARARFDGMERFDLTLEEARASALSHNLDLRVALVDPAIAQTSVGEEEGRFDSVFTLSGFWSESDQPTATTLEGNQTRNQGITPGLRVPLRTGGTAEVTFPVSRFATDNQFSTLPVSINTDVQFSLSHNLLRGAGRRATLQGLRIAEFNRQATEARTKLEVTRQLAAVDRAYWRLVAALEALGVRYQAYEVAVEQLGRAERRAEAGAAAEIEIVRASSGVADRVEQIIVAQNSVLLSQRALKRAMNMPGLDVDTDVAIIPVTDPDPARFDFDRAQLIEASMVNRMELLELEIRLAQDAADIAFQRNQALPLFALDYTYRINGLGATSGESLDVLGENDFEDWSVGFRGEIPLGNNEAGARVARAVLTRLQRLATREARSQAIEQEVLDAVDQLSTTYQRILASREAVLLNTRALDAERRQFDVGRSTSTDVLDADARLAEARLAEIQAVIEYQIAQIDLAFATGTLLGAARVTWQPLDPRTGETASESTRALPPLSGTLIEP
ncbi:MAG: TolC family protein [Planctomycetota bacterium]